LICPAVLGDTAGFGKAGSKMSGRSEILTMHA
jgi:hypothetical protein